MKASINNSLLSHLQPNNKPYDVRDNKLTGFLIRVNISGKMVYMCEYARGKRFTIGKVGVLTPVQARDRAKEILADAVQGRDPNAEKKKTQTHTLKSFVDQEYKPWALANQKCGEENVAQIEVQFYKDFGNVVLTEINPLAVEKWRTKRFNAGIKAATINRNITALKSALSKAIQWKLIDFNPLAGFKLSKIDSIAKLRFLNKEEEISLRKFLDLREEKLSSARDRGNEWRRERDIPAMPSLRAHPFADRMKPMILLSLNTGLRKGELLNLTWGDINFEMALLTVTSEVSKSGKSRHIPLNKEALSVLECWKQQSVSNHFVFPGDDGKPLVDIKKSWARILKEAGIIDFRWHDLRHHFASRLVMAGVDLNTVRELLGHADIKMTLRYAHLAPEHKADAVARLN